MDNKYLLAIFLVLLLLFFIFPVALEFLWNNVLVGLIDGVHPLNGYWEAFGLGILSSLLFKNLVNIGGKK